MAKEKTVQRELIDAFVARHRVKYAESAKLFKEQTGRDAQEIPAELEEFAAIFSMAATQSRIPGVQYFFVDIMTIVKNMMLQNPQEFLKQIQDENSKL